MADTGELRVLRTGKGVVVHTPLTDGQAMELLRRVDSDFARTLLRRSRQYKGLTPDQRVGVHKMVLEAGLAGNSQTQVPSKRAVYVAVHQWGHLFHHVRELTGGSESIKVKYALDGGRPVALSLAGPKSKFPGSINVTDGGPYTDNVWYGRVHLDGRFELHAECDGQIVDFIQELAADPKTVGQDCQQEVVRPRKRASS